jgi:CMP-N,N'-diacetyllegionaminic acid synthase
MKNILAIIPARSGSKGVPDKNIRHLGGHPLIAYSIAAAQQSKGIDRILVSTDSENYAGIARDYGAEVPFLRPPEISGDRSGDYEFIRHTLDWLHDRENYQPEYLVHLRPTTPFREVSYIEAALEAIQKNKKASALRSLHEMPQSAYKTFEIEGGYMKAVCSGSFDVETSNRPRQMFNTTYDANGYVDILKTSYVLANKKVHGNQVLAFVTPLTFEVDTQEDFDYLEYLISKKPMLVKRLLK